jgi:hypothetical protein
MPTAARGCLRRSGRSRPGRGPSAAHARRVEGMAGEDDLAQASSEGHQLGRWAGPVQGDTSLVGSAGGARRVAENAPMALTRQAAAEGAVDRRQMISRWMTG